MHIFILMPVYDDWESAFQLCRNIEDVFRNQAHATISVLIVDDGSRVKASSNCTLGPFHAIDGVSILVLRRNLGHQRAIAIGLTYLQQHKDGDAIVIMDADGEDRPEDIPTLLAVMKDGSCPTAVFAERGKRLEKSSFRFFYQCYRLMHRLVTGRDIRFGNFSVLPWTHLNSLVAYPELWNHYAATFIKSRLPMSQVRSERARRLAGESRMNFVTLVTHGLSALFADQEVVGTRSLIMIVALAVSLFLLIATVIAIKFLTDLAVPGWATTTMGLLLVLVAQLGIASLLLVFSAMMNRSQLGFLPIRDYSYFILREIKLETR